MRSPILAMLWENWRLTRREATFRLAIGIVGGSAVLAMSDAGATFAFLLLLSQHAFFWMSIAKLNGGRMLDGYKPGFPFYLLYARPVRTDMLVGVAMAYDAVSCAVLYLVSAALLGLAFGQPLPLLSVAVWIVAFHLVSTCIQWSTRNRVVQWLGSLGICGPFILLLIHRADRSPLHVEFSLAENALMASIGLVSFGLTVAGVSRQRHGDPPVAMPWIAGLARFPRRCVSLFQPACPTSSVTWAQVWFEMRSSGGLVLAVGLAIAMAIPLVFAVSVPIAAARAFAISVMVFALPVMLLLGSNAFGIRRKQGRIFASTFDATQPSRTARLAGVKILVRATCLLAALIVVGVSVWASLSLVRGWMGEGQEIATEATFWDLPRSLRAELVGPEAHAAWLWRHTFQEAFRGLAAHQLVSLAVIIPVGITVLVAVRAALAALWARYPRRLIVAGSVLLLYGFALVLLRLAGQRWIGLQAPAHSLFSATPWLATAATVLATAYLFGRVLAERLVTLRQACGAFLVSAAFGAAWVTVLDAAGVPLAGMPPAEAVSLLSPMLLPLMASALAPWSLDRIRHT